MKGIIINRRACELGPELDRTVWGPFHGWWVRGLELVILVGDTFHGWWRRVGGFVSIDVGRWAAGVFVGGLRIWGVRVLTSADGFPDTGGVEFGVFDLLESLEVGGWGVSGGLL